MKRVMLGALVGGGLLIAALLAFGTHNEVLAQRPPLYQPGSSSDLVVVPTALADGKGQVLTVIDPRQQVFAVYHVDLASGKIALRSVRNFRYDLQMTYLNNESPLPQEIRSLLEQPLERNK